MVAGFISSDDDEVEDPLPWSPPESRDITLRRADVTPASPLEARPRQSGRLGKPFTAARPAANRHGYRSRLMITSKPTSRTFASEPGRYLWVVLDLTGTTARTPQVRALRIEHPGHRLLSYLPRAWSRTNATSTSSSGSSPHPKGCCMNLTSGRRRERPCSTLGRPPRKCCPGSPRLLDSPSIVGGPSRLAGRCWRRRSRSSGGAVPSPCCNG